ncbi:MAG: hypothetical protein AVDCRST_MAG90-1216 [uncultured Microvirga sp.]|uniref:Uncharacterized protein n=1 Tax=uncultured Microvirga sp. TaxID=412392 RepID=A0A6J4L634_9HYPH|nr:MAG: hypothetical protein AVDCRST_MAG90-1216 [uncultured Microvirga sp.]
MIFEQHRRETRPSLSKGSPSSARRDRTCLPEPSAERGRGGVFKSGE